MRLLNLALWQKRKVVYHLNYFHGLLDYSHAEQNLQLLKGAIFNGEVISFFGGFIVLLFEKFNELWKA